MNGIGREYEYKPSSLALILSGAFLFGLGAVWFGVKAHFNDRGVIINHIIELGAEAATVFYWALCAACIAFVVGAAAIAWHRLVFHQRLAFGSAAMIVPVSRWSSKEKEIAYRDIQGLSTSQIHGIWFLYVMHSGGKYTICGSMLPSKMDFDEIHDFLTAKIRGDQVATPGARLSSRARRRIL